jgi:uncharacterized membrane protein YkoI
MYQEHAERILRLLHKSPQRGVITAAEASEALALLEQEVAYTRQHPDQDVEHDAHTPEQEQGESTEHALLQRVSFSARSYPLLEMLRSASRENEYIMWGV